jgi:hypothetical protein
VVRVEDWEQEVGRVAWTGPRTAVCAGVTYTVTATRAAWSSAQGGTVAVNVVINPRAGWKVFELVVDGKVVEAANDTAMIRNDRVRMPMEAAIACAIGASREWAPAPKAQAVRVTRPRTKATAADPEVSLTSQAAATAEAEAVVEAVNEADAEPETVGEPEPAAAAGPEPGQDRADPLPEPIAFEAHARRPRTRKTRPQNGTH